MLTSNLIIKYKSVLLSRCHFLTADLYLSLDVHITPDISSAHYIEFIYRHTSDNQPDAETVRRPSETFRDLLMKTNGPLAGLSTHTVQFSCVESDMYRWVTKLKKNLKNKKHTYTFFGYHKPLISASVDTSMELLELRWRNECYSANE